MASLCTEASSCLNDPNFAVICSFFEKFSALLKIEIPNFQKLEKWITNSDEIVPALKELHIKLLRKTRRTVHESSWETAISKFCYSYSSQDAWEIERFGYKNSSLKVKLRILRELLENQFDRNGKFRADILTLNAESLRTRAIGRDRLGHSYWLTQDSDCNFRVYQEHLDEDIWQIVASNRDEFVKLIDRLKANEVVLPLDIGVIDEDSSTSSSLEQEKTSVQEEKANESESKKSNEDLKCKSEPIPNIKLKFGQINGQDFVTNISKENTKKSESDPEIETEDDEEIDLSKKRKNISQLEEESSEQIENTSQAEDESDTKKIKLSIDEDKLNSTKIKPEDDLENIKTKEIVVEDKNLGENIVLKIESNVIQESCESKLENQTSKNIDVEAVNKEVIDDIKDENVCDETDICDEIKSSHEIVEAVEIGEEIKEEVKIITGEGSGAECDGSNYHLEIGEAIEEEIFFVFGEGSGADCDVGNSKKCETRNAAVKSSLLLEQKITPNKLSGETKKNKNVIKDMEPEQSKKALGAKTPTLKKCSTTTNSLGRKRRLNEEDNNHKEPSESDSEEHDISDEVIEIDDENIDNNIGGKRQKMRPKIVNTEIRKKVENERNVKNESSSEDEKKPKNKKMFPKMSSKDVDIAEESNEDECVEKLSSDVKEIGISKPEPLEILPKVINKEEKPDSKDDKDPLDISKDDDDVEVPKPICTVSDEVHSESEENKNGAESDKDSLKNKNSRPRATILRRSSLGKKVKTENMEKGKKKSILSKISKEDLKNNENCIKNTNSETEEILEEQNDGDGNEVDERSSQKKRGRGKGIVPLKSTPGKKAKTEEIDASKITKTTEKDQVQPDPTIKITPKKSRANREVDTSNIIDADAPAVRQSRRIAQLKIREEADRRKLEEVALKKMKSDLKKKKIAESSDPTVVSPSEHEDEDDGDRDDESVKDKFKKSPKKKKFNIKEGVWSSGSEEKDDEEDEHYYESDRERGSPLFKSDHEFSPESDLEDSSQVFPMKRARTLRKEGEIEPEVKDEPDGTCIKCGKSDHPEWILLCDKCDKGYHCSCLSPVLFYIPEGDWFCPPCQQDELITALTDRLKEYDDLILRKEEEEKDRMEKLAKERLAIEQAELERKQKRKKNSNIRRNKPNRKRKNSTDSENSDYSSDEEEGSNDEKPKRKTNRAQSNSSGSESNSSSESGSNSSSATDSEDEPIYKLRKRRQINVSYRLNEYDDLIKSALKEDDAVVAGAGNLGRGKDITTIIEADKEEKRLQHTNADDVEEDHAEAIGEEKDAEVETGNALNTSNGNGSNNTNQNYIKMIKKKKSRKLNSLDDDSGEDYSDEDFRTSSLDDEEDEDDESLSGSDSSLDVYRKRKQRGNKRSRRRARRAARERRKDKRFVVDSDESETLDNLVHEKRKKRKKHDIDFSESDDIDDEDSEDINSEELCDDSTESEKNGDGSWQPNKKSKANRKPPPRPNTIFTVKKKVAPKIAKKSDTEDNDEIKFKQKVGKQPISSDSEDSLDSGRRTRGRRFTYMEDFDDSSDGGIKPGVKRPDTPPEEREKFIKKQEEIKRMLAEKNKAIIEAAPTPANKESSGSLSTVPLSVIRQAKVLDIDYLQRKGESVSDVDECIDSDFDNDDELPDDFNPDDMDEEAIARMMEEEDFATHQLKLAGDVIRQKKMQQEASNLSSSPKKKVAVTGTAIISPQTPTTTNLLQNALTLPLSQPLISKYDTPNSSLPVTANAIVPSDPNKPRGRRKKITPLRDPLQKQQAAAALANAAAANTNLKSSIVKDLTKLSSTPEVFRNSPNINQASVITRMPSHSISGPRFYNTPPHLNRPHLPTHISQPNQGGRPAYISGPPPLRPGINRPTGSYNVAGANPNSVLSSYGVRPSMYMHQPSSSSSDFQPPGSRYATGVPPFSYYQTPPLTHPQSTHPVGNSVIVRSPSTVALNTKPSVLVSALSSSKDLTPLQRFNPSKGGPTTKLTELETVSSFTSVTTAANEEANEQSSNTSQTTTSQSQENNATNSSSSEFSGLVSYFSSQHDDLDET